MSITKARRRDTARSMPRIVSRSVSRRAVSRRMPRHATTIQEMRENLVHSKPLKWFKPGQTVSVFDRMQNYKYTLTARPGKDFDPAFKPQVSPAKMLKLGVFEGKYLNDCMGELPKEWFKAALKAGKLSPEYPDPAVNLFKIKSRQSLGVWRANMWIGLTKSDKDVRGWFQWYCRYWLGRRIPDLDKIQIMRWKSFVRHAGQITASYRRMANPPNTPAQKTIHRPKQRQALLQWAYDPYV